MYSLKLLMLFRVSSYPESWGQKEGPVDKSVNCTGT